MKDHTYFKLVLFACLCYILQGCKNDVVLPEQDESQYDLLYMPQAVNGAVSKILFVQEKEQTLIFGANVGGRNTPETDIKISFRLDADKLAAYNLANNTSYELPPAGSVTLSATEAVIKKGTSATEPLKLNIRTIGNNAIKIFKNYLIPITIQSDYKINEALRTAYFIIRSEPNIADYPDYNRANWKVIDFSSQEADGEGPNNGRAIFAFDDNINTFWHSQWKGTLKVLPHYVTVDMGSKLTIHGCNFIQRQASGSAGKADSVAIHYSLDNVTWQKAAGIHLQPIQSQQKTWLPDFVDARYLKFTVVTTHGDQFTNMAEIGAY